MSALFVDLDNSAGFTDPEEARATWFIGRDLLLSLRTEDHRNTTFGVLPGMRPWGFFAFEVQLPREILEDPHKFRSYRWEVWQYEYLRTHGFLRSGEAEAVGRLRERIRAEAGLRSKPE
jgi:hypothetical protein